MEYIIKNLCVLSLYILDFGIYILLVFNFLCFHKHIVFHFFCCFLCLELIPHFSSPSVQFSSFVQSCLILCDPMDCSMPGLPVHHQLLELAQTHVHWVGWCHPTISSSVVPFSSCLQSFPASGFFPMGQFFTSGGQSIGISASASVLPMNIQDWFLLGWTGWILANSFSLLLLLLSRFSHVRLCAIPETAAHQAPTSLGFSRKEHWGGLPLPSPMHESEKWKWSRSVVSNS